MNNSNISLSCINRSKLHLNRNETSFPARNFRDTDSSCSGDISSASIREAKNLDHKTSNVFLKYDARELNVLKI